MADRTYTRYEMLRMLKEALSERSGDPCQGLRNAVKLACKHDGLPPYSTVCGHALETRSKCMDEHYG